MTREQFEKEAFERGFARCFFLPPVEIEAELSGLISDPKDVVEGARTVIILIMAYNPRYAAPRDKAIVSPYYKVSNGAYKAAKELKRLLEAEGFKAESNVQLRLKKWLAAFGIGSFGKNSLIAITDIGSSFHVQALVTDAEFEYTHVIHPSGGGLSDLCVGCEKCVKACPSGAITGDGTIDASRCLRAVMEADTVPKEFESLINNRLLGCDVCQQACPRNANNALGECLAFEIEPLLDGKIDELKQLIGTNYARSNRIKKKACLLAANLKRRDLIKKLSRIAQSQDEALSLSAKRSIQRLEENT